jgi:hypothetical protein
VRAVFEVGFQAEVQQQALQNQTPYAVSVTPISSHARPHVGGGAGAPGLPKGKTKRGWGTRRGLLDDDDAGLFESKE